MVIGCLDPFEKVAGRGVRMLKDAGVEVVTGCLEKECLELNEKFCGLASPEASFCDPQVG